jgi:AcrR family transcriptional regulator
VLVAAAMRSFQQVGYHGTSMRDVATGAGVTVGAIYHHFGSKQEILQDIMVIALRDVIAGTRASAEQAGPTAREQLSAMVRAWIGFHTSRQPEALISAAEIRSLDPDGLRRVVELRDEQERLFRAVVQRGVAEGEFTTPHPVEATRAILTMGTSVAAWYRPDGPMPSEEVAETYVDLALGVVRSPAD